MPAKDSTDQEGGAGAPATPAFLDQADGAAPRPVTLETLNKLTLKQLLDSAKKMGLTAVSKLKKDALVQAVLEAWHKSDSRAVGDAPGELGAPGADAGPAARGAAPVPSLSHKFEVGRPGRADSEATRDLMRESAREIPWGYGRDRVTAMPVDSDRLFACWEVLDDSIATARSKLGLGGAGAWLNLRVYDTTGRIFDGTNAHGFFDHTVGRGDRQWFFTIGRPTSDAIIELGMKSHEGYFVKIARSARVEFPRREPAPPGEPEWLTVRVSTGQVEHGGTRGPGRPARFPAGAEAGAASSGVAGGHGGTNGTTVAGAGPRRTRWQDVVPLAGGGVAERHEWEEVRLQGMVEELRRFRWDGPTTISSWESGPFAYPVEIPEPVREAFTGKTRVLKVGGRTHVLYGPWQVIIRGLGAQEARVVLSRWEVYRTWAEETGHHVEEYATGHRGSGAGASERMWGASDRRWAGGSELRLGGSSELYFLKASELRLGGASELLFAGASQWVMRGASERLHAGASERLRQGASEQLQGGGFLGASEARLAGGAGGDVMSPGGDQGQANTQLYPSPPPPPDRGAIGNDDNKSSREGS